jgi:hypothetical protein
MKRNFIFLILSILTTISCEKVENPHFSSSIIGEWSWISSCGGIAGICYNPKSTNEKIKIVFTEDSVYNSYLNDTLKTSARFHIYKNGINFENSISQTFLVSHDTLYLNDFCCDGYNSNYKRVR